MTRKRELTITEFARMGGYAAAKSRTKEERIRIARKGGKARWAQARKAKVA